MGSDKSKDNYKHKQQWSYCPHYSFSPRAIDPTTKVNNPTTVTEKKGNTEETIRLKQLELNFLVTSTSNKKTHTQNNPRDHKIDFLKVTTHNLGKTNVQER